MRWFMVVGRCQPLFECDINATAPAVEDASHMHQFALHSALDLVEKAAQTKQHMYLGAVDKFNDQPIFAFLSPGNITFLLQYDGRSEEGVRNFFSEVHELYIKILRNPFYEYDAPITSPDFALRVQAAGRRHL